MNSSAKNFEIFLLLNSLKKNFENLLPPISLEKKSNSENSKKQFLPPQKNKRGEHPNNFSRKIWHDLSLLSFCENSRISPRHLQLAVRNDEELNQLMGGVTIENGEVLVNIHAVLLPKANRRLRNPKVLIFLCDF
jgi:hypothetical protein